MIPITDATKTALHQAVKQVRAQISWATSADTTETITSDGALISLKKEAEGYYCKSTLRKITVKIANTTTNLLDRRITALVQVKTGADTWGDINWGSFTITEATVDEKKGTSTFVGYGGIAMLQKQEYVAGELTFPTTVAGLAQQIAGKFGIEIETATMALPTEYQAVEYLEATGTQYLRIYTVTAGDKLTLDLDAQFTEATSDSQCIAASGGNNGSWYGQKESVWACSGGGGKSTIPSTDRLNARIKYGDTENTRIIVKNKTTGEEIISLSASAIGANNPFSLMAAGNGAFKCKAKIYSAVLYLNGTEIRRLIPCYRRSDNKPGLYDTIGGEFYTNAGTGEFTVGTDLTNLPNYDAPITEDLWAKISGTTYRDILEEIAGATGTIAVIGRGNDALDFDLPPISQAAETLTEANLITAKIGEKWGKVSAVVLSRQPQGDNIEVVDQATADLPAGKNLYDKNNNWFGGYYERNGTDAMKIKTWDNNHQNTMLWAKCTGGKTYTLSTSIGELDIYNLQQMIYAYSATKPAVGVVLNPDLGAVTRRQNMRATFTAPFDGYLAVRVQCRRTQGETSPDSMIAMFNQINDTFQVEAGSDPSAYEPYIPNGRVDLVIANNEILDKQRETTAQPILDAVKGWEYRNAEIKTEGHGYHEIGDRLDLTIAGTTYPTVVTKSSITIDGGIKEVLTSATPEVIPIDYAKSGGITKTVFRTELTVDKQAQQIDSIVSRQDATDAAVAEQFTQITQNLTEIVATAQASGGGNLIRNSVGFGKENDGTLTIWQYGTGATTTTVHSQSAPASLSAGAVSGHEIQMTGASTISQNITLTPGETYTLALRAKKNTAGAVTITVGNTTNSETITLAAGTAYDWQRQNVEFTPTMSANTVTITVPSGASVELTDLMLATGGALTWRQASGEIYNAQVSLDQAGVQVRSSVYTGDYVEITPLEFAGYSNASGTMRKVFSLNRETTEVEQLEARSQIKMPPIKIVPINNSSYKGWAFVKEE